MLQKIFRKLNVPMAAALALAATSALAQDYHVSEDYQPDPATADAGPVRMARISFVEGTVSWRPGSDGDWAAASPNLPLRQGAQLWVSDRSRAEIQFDDGSIARLGSATRADGGVVTLQTLYSDSKGEFTELSLSSGLIALKLANAQSLYQIDTGALSAKAYGPSAFRVGVGQGVEVVDRTGEVSVQNNGTNATTLEPRDSVYATDNDALMTVATAPMEDGFDQWVDTRDGVMIGHAGYVPANIAVCAGDLGNHGYWRSGEYGETWYPTVAAGWAPYHSGHWVFVRPFGWTWVADESWGWAPYHYGTWVNSSYGWGWVPGPAQQCWSPAVVHFTSYNGQVAWCALAPAEVHYAAIGVNLGGGLSLGFSIGSVGCYYPANNSYCEPRTFNNVQVNRITNVTNITTINNYYGSTAATSTHFVPTNASHNGASFVSAGGFGNGGTPQSLGRNQTVAFSQGQSMVPQGNRVLSGPPGVQVSRESFTPSHSFSASAPSQTVLNRPVVRPNVPAGIDKVSAPTHTQFLAPRQSNAAPGRVNPIRTGTPSPVSPNRPTDSGTFNRSGNGLGTTRSSNSTQPNPGSFNRYGNGFGTTRPSGPTTQPISNRNWGSAGSIPPLRTAPSTSPNRSRPSTGVSSSVSSQKKQSISNRSKSKPIHTNNNKKPDSH